MNSIPFFATAPSLPLLFFLSFLAATLLPVGSEWLLIVMVTQGFSPAELVVTATAGNCLGACTTYLIGTGGSDFVIRRILRMEDSQLVRASKLYGKYGSWSLLLSWLPVVGDPLCLMAGLFKVRFIQFAVLVLVGKFFRYAMLAFVTFYAPGGSATL